MASQNNTGRQYDKQHAVTIVATAVLAPTARMAARAMMDLRSICDLLFGVFDGRAARIDGSPPEPVRFKKKF